MNTQGDQQTKRKFKSVPIPADPSDFFQVVEVDDFDQWIKLVKKQMVSANKTLVVDDFEFCGAKWVYRGQMDEDFEITSSFERKVSEKYWQNRWAEHFLRGKERLSIQEFRKIAWHHVDDPNMSNLDWLTLMRHYGVSTRLVDFTESALVALYFALETKSDKKFAVWAINREALSTNFLQAHVGKEIPGMKKVQERYGKDLRKAWGQWGNSPTSDPDLLEAQEYMLNFQNSDTTWLIREALCLEQACKILDFPLELKLPVDAWLPLLYFQPKLPTKRMSAQHGLFMMASQLSEPFMKALYRGLELPKGTEPKKVRITDIDSIASRMYKARLVKFVFKRDMEKEALEWLRFANCKKSIIYPDLDGAAGSTNEYLQKALSEDVSFEHLYPANYRVKKDDERGCDG